MDIHILNDVGVGNFDDKRFKACCKLFEVIKTIVNNMDYMDIVNNVENINNLKCDGYSCDDLLVITYSFNILFVHQNVHPMIDNMLLRVEF
jgi:hypothetical protein